MFKKLLVLFALVLAAVPATAQLPTQRGSVEFGAFASVAQFENTLSLTRGYGGGGRIGTFLDHRWSIEFEDAEMRASRPHGLRPVNVGILTGRLVASDFKRGPFTFLAGAGAGISTETNFLHSYGYDFLFGFRLPINDHAALRVDATCDFLANYNLNTYQSLRVGISWFRHPKH